MAGHFVQQYCLTVNVGVSVKMKKYNNAPALLEGCSSMAVSSLKLWANPSAGWASSRKSRFKIGVKKTGHRSTCTVQFFLY